MPRRFFRKFAVKRHELSEKWFLTPFRHMLHDHRLWGIRRKNVVPSVSLGLFVACMPFPGHYLLGALLALALRINIPVAVLTTFISNPLTMGPIYYFSYKVGAFLLRRRHRIVDRLRPAGRPLALLDPRLQVAQAPTAQRRLALPFVEPAVLEFQHPIHALGYRVVMGHDHETGA